MKIALVPRQPAKLRRALWLLVGVMAFFAVTPTATTQVPPAGVLVGPTIINSLHNAGVATREQALAMAITANTFARRASHANYRLDQFVGDFNTLKLQSQALRDRFNWMAYLSLQSKRSQANNTLAELDAGLNIISELLTFLDQQFTAGTLDVATHVRTCRTLEEVMRAWERELRKNSARLGFF